jgi:NADPH-dependent 2,4-dienoyl-CoA reductase/sulfur reductase-like enzyme/nitrite reductase/ring-hydroxylating ferredoxin subunit
MSGATELKGPDLAQGVAASDVPEGGMLLGHAHGEPVLLVRRRGDVSAIGATCTHYGGPLADGLVIGDSIRCPWHHACFSLRTGEPVRAPALNPVPCFRVHTEGGRVRVVAKEEATLTKRMTSGPSSVVVVGAGAAGNACAETLRRQGYSGPIALVGAEGTPPIDRPNLSKDYLAGTAPEEWMALRGDEFYNDQRITWAAGDRVASIDVERHLVALESGQSLEFGALVLATGAEPVRLPIPGADMSHVLTLRTLADSRAIIARAKEAKRAVVVGASFIGLEVAASLRARNVEVDVVAPETMPLGRVLGDGLGALVRRVHEEHGVRFHLASRPAAIDASTVTLTSGEKLPADFVILGVGVRPAVTLAERAGIAVDRGIVVDERLRTSAKDVWAAGDVARWPHPRTGKPIRVEHWVVAGRMGQLAARSVMSDAVRCDIVPFFWSAHYDLVINYVGHAEEWDAVDVAGDLAARDAAVAYRKDGRTLAVATIGRDLAALAAEAAMENDDESALSALVPRRR